MLLSLGFVISIHFSHIFSEKNEECAVEFLSYPRRGPLPPISSDRFPVDEARQDTVRYRFGNLIKSLFFDQFVRLEPVAAEVSQLKVAHIRRVPALVHRDYMIDAW